MSREYKMLKKKHRIVFLAPFVFLTIAGPCLRAQTAATFGRVIALGNRPSDMILDESRQRLYLVNQDSSRIDILSTTTNAVIGSIAVGQGPLAAAMSMDSAFL